MPSGGHGSRGSFSRGGSSRGGRSSSFGSRSIHRSPSYHHHHPHRHIRIRIGRHYYGYSSGGSSILAVFLFFIVFAGMITMATGLGRQGSKDTLALYEEQHAHYQQMIEYAKEHEEYIIKATVTNRIQDMKSGKYLLYYEVGELKGETYPCYSYAESNKVGQQIDIAVDGLPITRYTDSVDMAFDNVTLEDDGDYIVEKEAYKTTSTIFFLSLSITILLIAGMILYIVKKMKLEDDEPAKEEKAISSDKVYCSYCGSSSPKSATKCSSCGAHLK